MTVKKVWTGIDSFGSDTIIGIILGFIFIFINSQLPAFAIGVPNNLIPLAVTSQVFKILIVVVLAPIVEEAFFRDILLNFLQNTVRLGLVIAILVQGLAFSLYHLTAYGGSFEAAQASFVGAAVFGILVGILAEKSENIWPGVIVHAMFNLWLTIKFSLI